MNSRCNCTYAAILAGLIAGIILGVIYGFGFVSTEIIFWFYLVFGALGVLLSPIYANASGSKDSRCFCKLGGIVAVSAIGAIIASAIGLIVSPIAPTVIVGIVLGLATLFFAMLTVSVLCLTVCKS